MKKLITVFCAAIAICGTFPAYAAEILDRETVAAAIWEDMWNGKDDNGRDYPEASYKHHLLDKWLDENYGSDDYDWSAIGELKREYKKYYRRLIDNWAFHDDNSGGWTIETEDNQYSFLMQCGTWQMIDRNGNTVDSFPPFSTLSDEPAESGNEPITDDKNSEKESPRVTGRTSYTAVSGTVTKSTYAAETVLTAAEGDSKSSAKNTLPIIFGIAAGSFIGCVI